MRVFVTGASGFVGSAIVQELVNHGHDVLGLVRAERAARQLEAVGAEALLGDVNDPEVLRAGVSHSDACIHTAFNHDFSQYKANCEADRRVIELLGEALLGSDKPLVITSGIGLLQYDRLLTENDPLSVSSESVPRAASEEAAKAVAARGGRVYTVRLPPSVHGPGDHGFVPILIGTAREKGESAYLEEGTNQWPAVHRSDAAALYRLVIEQRPALNVLHAVAEEGIAFRHIAGTIGSGLGLPTVSKGREEAAAHFGWFVHFAGLDCAASSEQTRRALGWEPSAPGLLHDIATAGYFS